MICVRDFMFSQFWGFPNKSQKKKGKSAVKMRFAFGRSGPNFAFYFCGGAHPFRRPKPSKAVRSAVRCPESSGRKSLKTNERANERTGGVHRIRGYTCTGSMTLPSISFTLPPLLPPLAVAHGRYGRVQTGVRTSSDSHGMDRRRRDGSKQI